MKSDSDIRRRRSIRLRGYDYSKAGMYFVTICTQDRECLFGSISGGEMILNDAGRMIREIWSAMPEHYGGTAIDGFVVMPNHIHGIVVLSPMDAGRLRRVGQPRGVAPTEIAVGAGPCACPESLGSSPLSLPEIVHRFKTMATKRYVDGVRQHGWPQFPGKLWQRNYWEHIVRNESELAHIREYIHTNPAGWELDKLNPETEMV